MDEKLAALAKRLYGEGVRLVFGITGSGPSLKLITALEELGAKYFPVAHEASAALMAGAAWRAGGKLAAAISIKGPGIANMLPGIVTNAFEGAASVSVAEAYGPGSPRHRKHKRMAQAEMIGGIVKGMGSLGSSEAELNALFASARHEYPGPVHIELNDAPYHQLPSTLAMPVAGGGDLPARLAAAKRPIVIAGSLALRRAWGPKLARLRVPVFTTAAAKGALDERLGHAAGLFTGDGRELAPEFSLFKEADLVLGLGLRNNEVLTPKAFPAPLVLIDALIGDVGEGFEAADVVIDPGGARTEKILDDLMHLEWGADSVGRALDAMRQALLPGDWRPAAVFEALNRLEGPLALVPDTGSFCTIAEHLWLAGPDRPFVGASNCRSMGTALPMAVGAALARPGKPVVCAVGDGGVGMYAAEMRLALEEKLPLCVILLADGSFASIAGVPQPRPMSRRATTVGRPSWFRAFEGMGCPAARVESAAALDDALRQWKRTGPLFIETPFDPAVCATMTERLR